jgi:amino acid permease
MLMSYGGKGIMVWALMQSIGEVTTMFPVAGGFIEVSEDHDMSCFPWPMLLIGR